MSMVENDADRLEEFTAKVLISQTKFADFNHQTLDIKNTLMLDKNNVWCTLPRLTL